MQEIFHNKRVIDNTQHHTGICPAAIYKPTLEILTKLSDKTFLPLAEGEIKGFRPLAVPLT